MSRSGDLPGDDAPASNGVRLTYDDFVLFPDDGQRHELIDGEHYVTPSPNLKHQAVLGNLHLAIGNWLAQHPDRARVLRALRRRLHTIRRRGAGPALHVQRPRGSRSSPPQTSRAPRSWWSKSAPRAHDAGTKRSSAASTSALAYLSTWIVDPELDVVRIHRRTDHGFARPVELSAEAGDIVTTPLLPGLELPLASLFRV